MQRSYLFISLLLLAFLLGSCDGYANFTQLCEYQLALMIEADPSIANDQQYRCDCSYSPNTLPCKSIPIELPQCIANAPGIEISGVKDLSEWTGPFVGFLLPSLVFALVIPRLHRISRHRENFGGPILFSTFWLLVAFIGVVIDVLLWIIICLGLVGLHIVGAVNESLTDWCVMGCLEEEYIRSREEGLAIDEHQVNYAIAVTLVGSFEPHPGGLLQRVQNAMSSPSAKETLEKLYAHQTSFGMQVGAPVVFYLGAYIYAIYDAQSKMGDNDTAHAISFGIWYGVIVISAICSCAVLGINNSGSIESIFGKSNNDEPYEFLIFENTGCYKASWLWDRVRCHQRWVSADGDAHVSPAVRKASESRWIPFFSCVITIGLVGIICILAFSISYFTPIVGFGCRSVTVFVYALSQVILVIIWFYHSRDEIRSQDETKLQDETKVKDWTKSLWISVPLYSLAGLCFVSSMFSSVGGTIMQLMGVYRNCICNAGLRYAINHAGGWVQLAKDTKEDRESAKIWIGVGIGGVCFIGFVSVLGWGYYMRMKAKCWQLIQGASNSSGSLTSV